MRDMSNLTYDRVNTGLVVIDPYNDFISEGGKVWDHLKGVAEANKCVPHMIRVPDSARKAASAYSMLCTADIAPATTRHGNTLRRFRRQPGRERLSNTARGVARSGASSSIMCVVPTSINADALRFEKRR